MRLVIGLGSLPRELIASALGDGFEFIATPSEADYAIAEAAIVRADFDFTKAVFESMPMLKAIARTGVGTDRVDLVEADSRKIPVIITPGSNSQAVAEGTFAYMLALAKRLPVLTTLVRTSGWNSREDYRVMDLEGKTLGLVGFGRIARIVAKLALAFGMEVRAFDPYAQIPELIKAQTLDELLKASHFLSVHVPLTLETRNLISTRELELIKDGAILVNCSRGGIVDLDAALTALDSGKLLGVGLDSFDPEPAEPHPIYDNPNVLLSPHVMGLSENAKSMTYVMAAERIRDFLTGKKVESIANLMIEGEK
jgi:D-3-phosphoglycerate dehydrogenase/(S)-sulfolactate dehydrogenase